ncbi:glycosyltransferase [Pediococcus acidilactici]
MKVSEDTLGGYSGLMSIYAKEKGDRFIKAMNTVLAQSIPPSEFVLVEDGPLTDELYSIIEDMEKKFVANKICFKKVYNEVNKGLGYSLNKGLSNTSYNLVARFDSDDLNQKKRIEKSIQKLKENPQLALLGSHVAEINPDDSSFLKYRKVPIGVEKIKKVIGKRNPFNHMTVVFKKDAIIDVGGYEDVPYFEDYYLWLKLVNKGYELDNIDEILVKACVDEDFYSRRSGLQYFLKEFNFQTLIVRRHYISKGVYIRNLVLRGGVRLMPKKFVKAVYSILRK